MRTATRSTVLAAAVCGLLACSGRALAQANIDWIKATETNPIYLSDRGAWPTPATNPVYVYDRNGGTPLQYIVWDDLHTAMAVEGVPGLKLELNVPGIGGTGPYKLRHTWTDAALQVTTPPDASASAGMIFPITSLPTKCGLYKLELSVVDSTGAVMTNTVTINEVALTYRAPAASGHDSPAFTLNSAALPNRTMLLRLADWIKGASKPEEVGAAVMAGMRAMSTEYVATPSPGRPAWIYGPGGNATPVQIAQRLLIGNGSDSTVLSTTARRTVCAQSARGWLSLVRLAGVGDGTTFYIEPGWGDNLLINSQIRDSSGAMNYLQMFDGREGNTWEWNATLAANPPAGTYSTAQPAQYTTFLNHTIAGINLPADTLAGIPARPAYFDPSFGMTWIGTTRSASDFSTDGPVSLSPSDTPHVWASEQRTLCSLTDYTNYDICPSGNPVGKVRQFFCGLVMLKCFVAGGTGDTSFGNWKLFYPEEYDNTFTDRVDSSMVFDSQTVLAGTTCSGVFTDLSLRLRIGVSPTATVPAPSTVKGSALMVVNGQRLWMRAAAAPTTSVSTSVATSPATTDMTFRFDGGEFAKLVPGITSTTPITIYTAVARVRPETTVMEGSYLDTGEPLIRKKITFTLASLGLTTAPFCPIDVGVQGGVPGHDCVVDNNDMAVFMGYLLTGDARADIAGPGATPGPDGIVSTNDEILFFDLYYFGCP
ncbi:MAG: GC-type dockerin domain-anchored protein [Phycisphaerales bacterium]